MAATRRGADWARRFEALIGEAIAGEGRAFAYGRHDCCVFAADCVAAITGADPGAGLRGYSSKRGAAFRLAKYGGVGGLAAHCFAPHEWPEVAPRRAQRGDVAMIETPLGQALGVVALNGRHVLVADERGVRALPLALAARAWRIG